MINHSTRPSAATQSTDTTATATPAPEAEALDSHQRQAKSAKALDHLLDQYRKLSDSERLKGNLFEQLVRQYLLLDSQMRTQFSEVYLWRDWPGNKGLPDTGIDLVAIQDARGGEDAGAVAIQCKFFAPTHRIQKKDIDSFLSESGKNPFVRRIVVETTGTAWSPHAEQAIVDQQIPITRIGLTDLRNSDIDWASYQLSKPEQDASLQERKSLRDHQVSAITDVFKGFEESARGTLVMACGTGKTFTSLKIAERLADDLGGSARILFMVPSLSLMSQTLGEWASECSIGFEAWSVCSDTKVNRKRVTNNDIADMAVVDLKTPPTTDPEKLATSLHRHGDDDGLQVVFATYQSIDVVAQAQELGGSAWQDFDLIICDEAHRTTGVTLADGDDSAFVRVHDNAIIRADKRLYMTATPRLFNDRVKDAAKEKDAVLCSMDDVQIYGPVFHKLGFGKAVSLGLLTDYKVVVLAVPEEEVSGIYQAGVAESGELTLPEIAKLAGCWNALAKRRSGVIDANYGEDLAPMRRAVAFGKDIKTSTWISQEFPALVKDHLQDLTNDDETDNLEVQCRHVDGSMNAVQRGESLDWLKDEADEPDHPVCRVLTNARCLSEGVDVPTLDAVLFLNPRKSQVDVIQAVGRVMRKAAGKEFGYIILPIAIPAGIPAEEALSDNKRYQVIWQVLQAIRAHDERFDNEINSIEFNKKDPTSIIVDVVNLSGGPKEVDHFSGSAGEDFDGGDALQTGSASSQVNVQLSLNFNALEWKNSVYSLIVKKVGTRLYWDDWSKDIAEIAKRFILLIGKLAEQPEHQEGFAGFVETLQKTLNPSIDEPQAIEMLAQHIITKPLFDAMFPDQRFTEQNPVSQAMQGLLDTLASNAMFENERQPLAKFYDTMVERIKGIDNVAGKQDIMRTLYDKFFSKAFPSMADRLGIAFTPVPVVDYILRSANDVLQSSFGKTLGDPGVSILEPFTGTGTFITRLLQLGLIPPEQLEYKYLNEIFGNEIVLLSYYIASINIEAVYREVRTEQGFLDEYTEFPGLALTDTFQIYESDGEIEGLGDFQANIDRVQRQKDANIKVIVMNPPYSAGQTSANDNNGNLKYSHLDQRISETYGTRSTASSIRKLYDSYFRALRWASDRIGDEGIIALISNSSFVDSNEASGVRLSLQQEFSDIYVYNLRGGIRGRIGESARREGGNVFEIMTGVAITILVKSRVTDSSGQAHIHYQESDDYLTRQEKLNALQEWGSVSATSFENAKPNRHGDWIEQRDEQFSLWQAIGEKTINATTSISLFASHSLGLATGRDAWCTSFSRSNVQKNVKRMIDNYNSEVARGATPEDCNRDAAFVSWSSNLTSDLSRGQTHTLNKGHIRSSSYRPFVERFVYFDRSMNERIYRLHSFFSSETQPNVALTVNGDRRRESLPLITSSLPDLHFNGDSQCFPLYTWSKSMTDEGAAEATLFDSFTSSSKEDSPQFNGTFDFARPIGKQVPTWIDGYERRDNITDATLAAYREHYKDEHITKEDIFFYVYALLHHPTYRERYEADLKKMLPRIPKVAGFGKYSEIGRKLAHLHVNYEQIEPHPLDEEWKLNSPKDPWERYHVTKLAWGRRKDTSRLFYNDHLTLSGFPPEINQYQVGGRSPIEWMIDRYKITQDRKSGIVNDPNGYFRDVGNPRYLVDLIKSLVTVSISTQDLIAELPDFVVDEEQ